MASRERHAVRSTPSARPGRRAGRRATPASGAASGFVLAVTLWLLAGIAVATALITLWAREQVVQARIGRESVEDEIARFGTRDTLLYLAATREMTRAGLPVEPLSEAAVASRRLDEFGGLMHDPIGGELRMDGTAYAGLGSASFAVQDEAGLFPVVWPQQVDLDRFLLAQGVAPEQVPRLRDALLDYIDPDDLNRLNGAERRDYAREHRPPPPNRRLLTPQEISRVLGWDALPADQLARIAERITPYYSGAVNLNTMPAALLPTWIAGCPAACEQLVLRRGQVPFANSFEVQALLATSLPGDDLIDYRYIADEGLRLTVWGRTGAAWRFHVRLTPLANRRAPWSILASYPLPRPSGNDQPAEQTGSALFADPEVDRR